MGLSFQVLGTSSAGNCTLIESGRTRILLDAGFSGRKLEKMLQQVGKPIETIDAVFLTHEHSDHIAGLRGLSRHKHLQFFANYGTAQVSQSKLSRELRWKLFETGSSFAYKDLTVETVLLPHDAMEPVGFVFHAGDGSLFDPHCSLAWITDLGHTPPSLAELVREARVLILESNHDTRMLEDNEKRPFSLKQRISGRHGHLSNRAAREFIESVDRPLWRRVLLGHLSRDCNHPDRVRATIAESDYRGPVDCLSPEQLIFPQIDLACL